MFPHESICMDVKVLEKAEKVKKVCGVQHVTLSDAGAHAVQMGFSNFQKWRGLDEAVKLDLKRRC